MSVAGASIASSVAQSPVQAQQTAGTRDRTEASAARETRDIRDLFQAHLSAIEEDESDPDAAANPRVDKKLPENQTSSQGRQARDKRRPAPAAQVTPEAANPQAASPVPPTADSTDSPLYRHLDVQA